MLFGTITVKNFIVIVVVVVMGINECININAAGILSLISPLKNLLDFLQIAR